MLSFERDVPGDAAAARMASFHSARANRRRFLVFLGVFVVALGVGLGWSYSRPPEYRASTRVQIIPATAPPVATGTQANPLDGSKPFLIQVQVLTSRPILEIVAKRLESAGQPLGTFGPDPIAGMQARLNATPLPETNVAELVATGDRAETLALLLNGIVDVYSGQLADAYRNTSKTSTERADTEVQKLKATVEAKRQAVEAFRLRSGIVSLERDENEVLARVRNLSTSLNLANEKAAAAEGRLKALSDAAAAGQNTVRAADNPVLANLEQRTAQMREEMRELERTYTPAYLAKDPKVVALRARLAESERQVKEQREIAQTTSLQQAREEYAAAQGAVARIRNQMVGEREEVGRFAARFNEYRAQQADLTQLEAAYRDAMERRAKLEASERTRMPTINILEAASIPAEPWRPLYTRDAAIILGASLLLALLAMGLVELFNRPGPQPPFIVAQAYHTGMPQPQQMPRLAGSGGVLGLPEAAAAAALLPQPIVLPRELIPEEVTALLHAADSDGRLVLLLLLGGVSEAELPLLRGADVDLARSVIRVGGPSKRELPLAAPLLPLLAGCTDAESLIAARGNSSTADAMDAQIFAAAHDAGIDRPAEVTASAVRHTYIAYLVRQGIRFADLPRVVGHLSADVLGGYSALSAPGARLPFERIDPLFPAVRELDAHVG